MADLAARLEAVLADIEKANSGLCQYQNFASGLQRLQGLPFLPAAYDKARTSFKASGDACGALRAIIKELKQDG